MKISYCSLGCKVNLYESEAVLNQFLDHGFELGQFDEVCDVYLINTCSITAVSDAKSRKMIRQANRRNPQAIIAVMGCYAQLNPDTVSKMEGVDIMVGTNHRHRIFDMVMDYLKTHQMLQHIDSIANMRTYEEIKIRRFNQKTRGFVKIQDGCNNFCSYCTIPYARGPVRSRLASDVIDEIRLLTDQHMKEIILTGINTASYGHDLKHYDFADLLLDIIQNVPNVGRIRISSIEMTEITPKLIEVMRTHQNYFCKHLHVPLQGGTDEVLKRMRRKYSIDQYREKIQSIRHVFPYINITTDVLAGFSGETTALFEEACAFIQEMQFGEMHIFPYSKRPLTAAYQYLDHIDEPTKHQRVFTLLQINEHMALAYRMQFLHQIVEVLVEKKENGVCYGHSSEYIQVEFRGTAQVNELARVRLESIHYPISKGGQI